MEAFGGALAAALTWPAVWGFLGAFIYAAPRWVACLVACREAKASPWPCALELAVALATGSIAAAAFSATAMALSHVKDANAVSAMVGLLANPTAPKLVTALSSVVATAIAARKPGDPKLP